MVRRTPRQETMRRKTSQIRGAMTKEPLGAISWMAMALPQCLGCIN